MGFHKGLMIALTGYGLIMLMGFVMMFRGFDTSLTFPFWIALVGFIIVISGVLVIEVSSK